MMREIFTRGVNFIRRNPTIIYSLLLIVATTAIVFLNTYLASKNFQENVDRLTWSKAILVEDVLGVLAQKDFSNKEYLSAKLKEIKEKDNEIGHISILIPGENLAEFNVAVSTQDDFLKNKIESEMLMLAWNNEDKGVAKLAYDENQNRYWNATKVLKDEAGKKAGLISLSVSLKDSDVRMENMIKNSYLMAILGVVVVLLLVLNHIRLFRYEIKATKLEDIDKMKDDFISMVSHELKSPLTAIRGYVELFGDSLDGVEENEKVIEQRKYLQNINISVGRLRNLVEDLLEVSRIEQNRMPVNPVQMDLSQALEEIVSQFLPLASEKKLYLKNIAAGKVEAFADPERVKQILVNLISNAIKYTQKGGVEISCKDDYKFVYLTVADSGFGMSAEDLKNLFGKFYRVKTEETQKIPGTGLGLWISREIAIKMGGDITVESIQGIGSHFTLKLPKKA